MSMIEINDKMLNEFDKYASILGKSKESFIKEALIEKLQDIEDYIDAKSRYENPNSEYISLDDL